jgi:hypothetical protein
MLFTFFQSKQRELTIFSWVYRGETAQGYSEVDIFENVNKATANSNSFYTSEPCTVNYDVGTPTRTNNCQGTAVGQGCSSGAEEGTFNQGFNDNYRVIAMQVETNTMRIWHFRKNEVPADLSSGNPDPSKWKRPTVALSPKSCNFQKAFSQFKIVCVLLLKPLKMRAKSIFRSSTSLSVVDGPVVITIGTYSVLQRRRPTAKIGLRITLKTSKTPILSSTPSSCTSELDLIFRDNLRCQ